MRTTDVLAPRSRHNRHVTTPEDVVPVGGWTREELFAAVEAADDAAGETIVVVDYGRSALYLAPNDGLRYEPPRALGVAAPPVLHVADPARYDPATGAIDPISPDDPAVRDPQSDSEVEPGDPRSADGDTPRPTDDRRVAGDGRGPTVVTITPRFDLLVPAFDWEEQSDDDLLPPLDRRSRPTETGTGTPG